VVRRLLGRQARDGREHAKRVAREHDDVARLAVREARDARAGDVLDRVRAARVLRERDVVVVGHAVERVEDDVLEDRAVADGAEDLRLLLRAQVDALGVAAALDVEDARVGPDVLVVADQRAPRVRRQRRLARAREPEEEGHVAVVEPDVRGRVQRELAKFDRLQVVLYGQVNTSTYSRAGLSIP
jgi:hypothetical protein